MFLDQSAGEQEREDDHELDDCEDDEGELDDRQYEDEEGMSQGPY